MEKFQPKLGNQQITIFSEMSALAKKAGAINLGQGFPDFPPPEELLSEVRKSISEASHQYAPMPGDLRLRQAISQKIFAEYGIETDPEEEITVTAGATQAIFTAISAFVRPGEEVIIFEPAYDCYRPAIRLAGGVVVAIQLQSPDFSVSWSMVAQSITEKTRMIIINTPHNPTGTILKSEDMQMLSALVRDTGIVIISDEVYEHLIYDGGEHASVFRYGDLRDRSLSIFSFGKSFHCTGWKLGYCVGPAWMMKHFRQVHQWVVFSVNSVFQPVLASYLATSSGFKGLSSFYQTKREYFLDKLAGTGLLPLKCEGTFFQLVDYSSICAIDDVSFARWLTTEIGVAAIPVSVFSEKNRNEKLVRFCFAKSETVLDEAGVRLLKLQDQIHSWDKVR